MQSFNLRALEFAKSHLEDIPYKKKDSKIHNSERIIELHDVYHKTFAEIALLLHVSKTHVHYLYKKGKNDKKSKNHKKC